MPQQFLKDPEEDLDYKFDFAGETNERSDADGDWLASGETISTKEVTADSGITVDEGTISDTNTSVVVQVSGGTDGTDYKVYCKALTSNGNTVKKAMLFKVKAGLTG